MSQYLFVLLLLACPLAMWLVMRGGHGHGHTRRAGHDHDRPRGGSPNVEELRRRRDDLDRELGARERLGTSSGDRSARRT